MTGTLLKTVMGIVGRDRCLDDCAVIPFGDQVMVATTDMLHADDRFCGGHDRLADRVDERCGHPVGYREHGCGTPTTCCLPSGLTDWKQLAGVMQGAQDCCTKYGAEIIGGDIDRHCELTIVSTGLGVVGEDNLVRRTGAQTGDLVCVTGTCGQAQAFLEGYPAAQNAPFRAPAPGRGRADPRACRGLGDDGCTATGLHSRCMTSLTRTTAGS